MFLELKKSPDRFLDLTLPNKTDVRLIVSPVTVAQSSDDLKKIQTASAEMQSGKMSLEDYISISLSVLVSNWPKVKAKILKSGLEYKHVTAIREAVESLRTEKEDAAEKKSQEKTNTKS